MKTILMVLKSILIYTCVIFFFSVKTGISQNSIEREAIISVDRIWDRGQHNAFTSLIFFNNKYYVAFREGAGHVSDINGTIRVISSEDGQNWSSVAHLDLEGVDLRDAQLSVSPDDKIMLNMGGSVYIGSDRISMAPVVSFSDINGMNFSKPSPIKIDSKIVSNDDWLWKATWHKGISYATVYQVTEKGTILQLVKSSDGIQYEYITTFDLAGSPNETTLRFTNDDKMIAIIRRAGGNSNGYIGRSDYPYTSWKLNELTTRLGGPNLIELPNGKMLCGTREYPLDFNEKMILGLVNTTGYFKKILTLPSGGDCSYPGLLIQNDLLYISYYSSHEEKTAVYFAKVRLDKILELTARDIAPEPYVSKNENGIIELKCDLPNTKIIYTLDGTQPSNANGRKYDRPFKIKMTKLLRAISYYPNYLESSVISAIIGQDVFHDAISIDKKYEPGLTYHYYNGEYSQVIEIQNSEITESGVCKNVSIQNSARKENFGYIFNGFIQIPEDDIYSFYLESNDGSVFELNNEILINNDGSHGKREIESQISLRKGMHKIKVIYFQMGGGAFLKLFWKSKGFYKQEIPASAFFH